MKVICLLLLILTTQSFATIYTYRLKVIDMKEYDGLTPVQLKNTKSLEVFTTIKELQFDFPALPKPILSTNQIQVCLDLCDDQKAEAKPSKVMNNVVEFIYGVDTPEFRQVNVFYYILQTIKNFEALGFKLEGPKVHVRIDRKIKELMHKGEMSNNAFYDPSDNSMNFVPSKDVALLGLFKTESYLDTAYDPVVMAHEFTHLVIKNVIGNPLNADFDGMNEGTADFFASEIYGVKNMGNIFGKGKPIRTFIGNKQYQIGMEAHDLGEVYAQLLYQLSHELREQFHFEHFNQSVFNSFACLKENLFFSLNFGAHCIKEQLSAEGLGSNELGTILNNMYSRKIDPRVFENAPKELPIKSYQDRTLVYYSDQTTQFDKINSHTQQNIMVSFLDLDQNFGWYAVKTENLLDHTKNVTTIVLMDNKSAQIIKSFGVDGKEITAKNANQYQGVLDNASALQQLLESELSSLNDKSKGKQAQCHVGDLSFGCTEVLYSTVDKILANSVMTAMGMNTKIEQYEEVRADNSSSLVFPFTLIKQNVVMRLGARSDGARISNHTSLQEVKDVNLLRF